MHTLRRPDIALCNRQLKRFGADLLLEFPRRPHVNKKQIKFNEGRTFYVSQPVEHVFQKT